MASNAKVIDWKVVDELLACGCHGVEIAATLGIHPETLYNHTIKEKGVTSFSLYSQEKRAIGDKQLKKKQHEVALEGNPTMLIWLGKQRLDQKEKDDSKAIEDIKANLDLLTGKLAGERAEHIATQSKDRSSLQDDAVPTQKASHSTQ